MQCSEPGCPNHDGAGEFVGAMCYSCYMFYVALSENRDFVPRSSQAYRNARMYAIDAVAVNQKLQISMNDGKAEV